MDYILYMVREDLRIEDIKNTTKLVTANIYEALDYLRLKPMVMVYDLIFGLDILKMIRSNPKYHHLKIIVATYNENYGLLKKAYLMGADYYIHLPINYVELGKIVEAIKIEKLIFIQNFSFCFPKNNKIIIKKRKSNLWKTLKLEVI